MKVHYILGDAPLSAIAQDQICREISLKKLGVKPILGDVPKRVQNLGANFCEISKKKKIPPVAPKWPLQLNIFVINLVFWKHL